MRISDWSSDVCSSDLIRAAIDALDHDIVTLLSERMRYIDAAARVKQERDTVRDEQRKAEVIAHAVEAAGQMGLPTDLASALYEQIVEYSIAHELKVFDARQPRG